MKITVNVGTEDPQNPNKLIHFTNEQFNTSSLVDMIIDENIYTLSVEDLLSVSLLFGKIKRWSKEE